MNAAPPPPGVTRTWVEVAMIVLAALALGHTVALARPVLLPVTFAWLVKLLLAPLVRALRRARIPTAIGAALVLALPMGLAGWGIYRLSEPAAEWAHRLPEDIAAVQRKLRSSFRASPLDSVNKASKAVAELTDNRPEAEKPIEVAVVEREPSEAILFWLQRVGIGLSITLVLSYLLLLTDDAFVAKMATGMGGLDGTTSVAVTIQSIEANVARYLATITVTNLCLGIAVGTITWLCGLPNPGLWGAMAALLNFVPYLGALAGVAIVAIVGIGTAPTLGQGLAPACAYAVVNSLEGMLITPMILGRRLRLSPVALFTWLLLLGWIWGVPGALVAVPLLATVKIVSDHIPALVPLRRLLGR